MFCNDCLLLRYGLELLHSMDFVVFLNALQQINELICHSIGHHQSII